MEKKKLYRKTESDPQRRLEQKLFWKSIESASDNHEVLQ